ncbi:chemotaxis protein CheX [Campylobacter pinnipediorum]|uniref:Restriction endonuclease n=1 Tax=Campylobacter pinnipediorum subsp. pinnipediorum TaxID=1660067 RepID=A0AAX0LBH1_9BACT|nr:restriction endonuclease [Campylobacter pinnipediorum]OPA81614.1 restriction endonuclease [Campylobacter pinnipediorum subsp. pinnipediorum]
MKSVIDDAVNYLCVQTLGFDVKSAKSLGKGFYGASIPLYKDDTEFNFYLFFKKDTLKNFANAFFGQDDVSEADFDDLSKEISNQIIGRVKVVLNNSNDKSQYKLGTPEFLGEVKNFNIKLDDKIIYKMKNRTFQIGYKKV